MNQPVLEHALITLDESIPDPSVGLPYEVFLFISRFTPLINVDLLIKDDLGRVLLTWRDDQFYGPGWHVPGGIIRYREMADARIRATAREELAAEVEFDQAPIAVEQFINRSARERAHFISLLYLCRIVKPPAEALKFLGGGRPIRGQWSWHACCPEDLIPEQAGYRRFFQAAPR